MSLAVKGMMMMVITASPRHQHPGGLSAALVLPVSSAALAAVMRMARFLVPLPWPYIFPIHKPIAAVFYFTIGEGPGMGRKVNGENSRDLKVVKVTPGRVDVAPGPNNKVIQVIKRH